MANYILPPLKHLDFQRHLKHIVRDRMADYEDEDEDDMVYSIERSIRDNEILESVDFCDLELERPRLGDSLLYVVFENPNVKKVRFTDTNNVNLELLTDRIKKNTTVTQLIISCTFESPSSFNMLLDALAKNKTLTSVYLSLDASLLDTQGSLSIPSWIATNDSMKSLGLAVYEGMISIDGCALSNAIAINQTLDNLYLFGIDFHQTHSDDGDDDVTLPISPSSVESRHNKNRTLKKLSIHNFSGDVGHLIEGCSALTSIEVSIEEGRVPMDSSTMVDLCTAMRANSSLSYLFLSVQLCDSTIGVLAEFVATHETLRSLSLQGENITDDGLLSIASALQTNAVLQSLTIANSGVAVSGKGSRAFLDAIYHSNSLTNVAFYDAKSDNLRKGIEVYMARKKYVKPLLDRHIPLDMWPYVLHRMSERHLSKAKGPADLLYYLVQQKHMDFLPNIQR